jgi:hypothetical protein
MEQLRSFKEFRDALQVPSGEVLSFSDPVDFLATVRLYQLIETPIEIVDSSPTIINVLNITRVELQNTSAVTVTNLIGGQEGQEVKFRGDGFTTIQNGTNFFTNTGANKLLAVNKVYTFTKFSSGWIENA